jgi:hypothetical protein
VLHQSRLFRALGWAVWASVGAIGCGAEPALAPSPVSGDVERDAWLDSKRVVSGDGETQFVSGPPRELELHWPPNPIESYEAAGPAPAAVFGQRVYALSMYAGLVISDASEAGPSRIEGRYPLVAAPFAVSVQDGIVLALVNEGGQSTCLGSLFCQAGQQGHVLLIDARDPSSPRLLAERLLPGTLTHAYQRDNVLYTVSRELVACTECERVPEQRAVVSAIGRDDPLALADLGQLELPTPQAVARAYRFSDGRLYVASSDIDLRIVELDRGVRLGAVAPLSGGVSNENDFVEEVGVVRIGVERGHELVQLQYRTGAGELAPIQPVLFHGPRGEVVQPVFHAGGAFALSEDGRVLYSYDLGEREAPRLIATLALPWAATGLAAAGAGELVAFGTGELRGAPGTLHAALLGVREPEAPLLLDELSWGTGSRLDAPRYDATSGLLFFPYQLNEVSAHLQLVSITGPQLALGRELPAEDNFLIVGDRLVTVSHARIRSASISAEPNPVKIPLGLPADAVRVISDRLVRFRNDSRSAELLPLELGDPLMELGTDLQAEPLGVWRHEAFEHAGQLYLAQDEANHELGVRGFELSGSSSTPAMPNVVSLGERGDGYLDVIQSSNNLIAVRGALPTARYSASAAGGLSTVTRLSYDIIDLSDPLGPRLAGSFDVPEALAAAGFQRLPNSTSIDTAGGWQTSSGGAPLVVAGDLLVSQHFEAVGERQRRFFLDRLDVSNPDLPLLLPPVNIPGSVLAFDADSGSLLTLETLSFEEHSDSRTPPECEPRGYISYYSPASHSCQVARQALNGLSVEGDVATRHSRLLLDTSRRALMFAVSGADVYYVTEPLRTPEEAGTAGASRRFTLEHVHMSTGELERFPSVDVSELHQMSPRGWATIVARGTRVFSVSGRELGVVDFGVDPPSVRSFALPPWGCPSFDVAGDKVFCAGGAAGLQIIDLRETP